MSGTILGYTRAGVRDHGRLVGLGDDDHSQYFLLAGRASGQTASGGNAASENLTLQSTSHATRGSIVFDTFGTIDNVGDFILGTSNPLSAIAGRGIIVARDSFVEFAGAGFSSNAVTFRACVAGGTVASPSATVVNDRMHFSFGGHNGTGFVYDAALIRLEATQTWSGTARGTRMLFFTTNDDSTTLTERMRIKANGDVAIDTDRVYYDQVNDDFIIGGTAHPVSVLAGRGFAMLRDGTAEFGALSHGADQTGFVFRGIVTEGTIASPSATTSGQRMAFSLGGHDGTNYVSGGRALLFFDTSENWTSSAQGAFIYFETTADGTTSPVRALTIDNKQNLVLESAAASPSTGTKGLFFGDGTAPSSLATNTAGLYANDVAGTVEMFAIDEAGNSTQLSSHNFDMFDPEATEDYPWSFYSQNPYLGLELGVDIPRMCRIIERVHGVKLVYHRDIPTRDWVEDQRQVFLSAAERYDKHRQDERNLPEVESMRPTVKRPPDWLKDRMGARYSEAAMAQLEAEVNVWRVDRGLPTVDRPGPPVATAEAPQRTLWQRLNPWSSN